MAGDHVFESYIRTSPEALWRALTDGAITPLGTACKLTLIHRDLDPVSPHAQAILGGWPVILSGLKTLLETGEPLVLSA